MTLQELESILRQQKVFEVFGITELGVFGSFARGEDYHDIDFLLEQDLDFNMRQKLKRRLTKILGLKIDLVPSKYADPIILYRAQKELKYVRK
ncbi:nucleotidyltransferase domain-containing protein [Runella sp. MFBS21]|uniref:nucleotidyltransferase family protein n=1 Tax=Runella sp. MFBS21 TaxID=3034018 RepID=UPI0023F9263C|nr:nucleotidyltransferase domain-containing protein [Runella sp. MFBS21]MDF7821906.1 nucleotidyltransferase domain-containing protein [Runella sp. MFBS21]